VASLEQNNQLQARIRHQKNIRAIGLKTAQENNDKYEERRTQSTAEGRHWSSAESVFVAQIVLQNKFLQNDEFSVDTIVQKFSKTLHVSAPSLSRRNSSTDLPSELPAELFSAPLIWVSRGGLVPPLQLLYDGPYAVLRRGPRSSPSESVRMMRWSLSAALRLARPQTPRLGARVAAADCRAHAQADLPQPSESCFQTRWFLCLLLHRCRHATVLEPFSYLARRFLPVRDRRHIHSLHKHGTRPVSRNCLRGWTSDLLSFQPRPVLTSTV
jgi:hypothetical protein